MNILHTVEFYNPSVGGAQEVVKQLSEHLVMLGHEVTVATTKLLSRKQRVINGVKIKQFDISGNAVRGYAGKDVKKYQQFLIKSDFDVMMNYAAQQWSTDLALEVIDQIKARKVFVPCGFSGLYDPQYSEYFKKLPALLRKYDKTVYLSEDYRDINFAKKHKINNRVVIANGADEREFATLPKVSRIELYNKYSIPVNNKLILCVSNHTGLKGHKEAIAAFNKAKIPNSSLVFVGDINKYGGCYNACSRSAMISLIKSKIFKNSKTINLLNINRSETIKLFAASDIFLFLSNIECSPLVLFEAAASGTPFIASDCGNAKEIAHWTKSGFICKTFINEDGYSQVNIDDVVNKLNTLLSNPNIALKLGSQGRKNWNKKYTWKALTDRYLSIYSI